ncbi:MAG: type VI secretion system baseplate subunit TssG, partial [Holosporales bacterium]|nr:type VI secretion system baseplate subunit TssG [Holosporales bacterium]
MVPPIRISTRSLIQRLREEPYRFSFDQALMICRALDTTHQVRLKGSLCFSLPAWEIAGFQENSEEKILITHRLDLLNAQSTLPIAFRSVVLSEKRAKRPALEAFLDIFHHRFLDLSYQIARRRLPALQQAPEESSFLGKIRSVFSGRIPATACAPSSKFSGHLWAYSRSLATLEVRLQHFFGFHFRVCPFQGAWRRIDQRDWTRLGRSAHRLGKEAMLGTRSWDQTYGLDLQVTPETSEDF